jgi:hypothetical protein
VWIESHTVLVRHRKLIELAKDLRLAPVHVMGHLHALWHAALEQQEDGDLSSWSDELIAQMSCYPGDAPQFVRLLQTHGWLDGKLIHDWPNYAGKYLVAKYRTSNPKKLRQILFKFKSVNSQTKVGRKPIRSCMSSLSSENEKGEGEISVGEFVQSWNEAFRGRLPEVQLPLAESRRRKVCARLKEHPTRDFWEKVFGNINTSNFLLGQLNGDWRCTLDWLVSNDANCLKVVEGDYNHD